MRHGTQWAPMPTQMEPQAPVEVHKKSGRKRVVAGIAALGMAAGAYGVFATTLNVTGSAGTQLQAGTSVDVASTGQACLADVAVTENYTTSAAPYVTTRESFQVVGTDSGAYYAANTEACNALTVTVAAQIDGTYIEQTTTTTIGAIVAAGGAAIAVNAGLEGDANTAPVQATAFSVKVS